jgi:hypothetical protein
VPNLFTVTIPDSAAALLVTYGEGALIRVQSSPTQAGVYGDVMTIPIVTGIATYSAYDATGAVTDWYKIRYEAADGDPAGLYSAAFQPMPLEGLYASLGDFNLFLRDSGTDTADDVLKLLALEAASRAIDRTCNRPFTIAGVAAARYFTPFLRDGRYTVGIDDVVDTAGITVEIDTGGVGTYVASTAYHLAPRNAPAQERPYTEIIFDAGTYAPIREDSVRVTAAWGWDAIPATITNATLMQAARFFRRRDAVFGIAGAVEMGSEVRGLRLLPRLDPDVQVMVGGYRKWWGAG